MRAALPDFEATIEVLIAQDDYAANRVIYSGTFTNEWVMGDKTIAPNDEEIAWTSIIIYRFNEDGQIAEEFTSYDQLDLLLQLEDDVLPPAFLALIPPREIAPAVVEDDIVYDDALTEKSRAFLIAVIEEAINNGDLDVINASMPGDYRTHEPFGDFTTEQFRDAIAAFRAIVPDLNVEINILFTENNWLATRLIYRGTFANEIPLGIISIEPTQKPIEFVINVLVHFDENGVGLEDFKEYNRLSWLRQIGVLEIDG